MPEPVRDLGRLEQRLSAVEAVQQVMRAVWALARAQQPHAEAAAAEAGAYFDTAASIVARLAGEPHIDHEDPDVLWVLVGPERAFCGPLARMLLDQLPETGAVGLAGARLIEVARQLPSVADRVAFEVGAASTAGELGVCADRLATQILAAPRPMVVLLHPDRGTPTLRRSVLLAGAVAPVTEPPETFLPPEEVLEAAVGELVAGRLAVALAEALRAEVRARLTAAEAARRACDRQLDELRYQWRALRQASITQELLELTAGRRA
ncbi:MAG: F0F1 ATP synthase subunit gamma [Alphaproteobacteria bacterium]|nr:F0F1 ATP synthase subunit gamma [Alphaproteobacteria bacterium]MCB9791120.1 F0F1 ATP synthase subunit gamma [Alphaproteobacteria bacterium]